MKLYRLSANGRNNAGLPGDRRLRGYYATELANKLGETFTKEEAKNVLAAVINACVERGEFQGEPVSRAWYWLIKGGKPGGYTSSHPYIEEAER